MVKKDINEKLIKDIEAIEESKDDSHRMYNAVKVIQRKKGNEQILIKKENNDIIQKIQKRK